MIRTALRSVYGVRAHYMFTAQQTRAYSQVFNKILPKEDPTAELSPLSDLSERVVAAASEAGVSGGDPAEVSLSDSQVKFQVSDMTYY